MDAAEFDRLLARARDPRLIPGIYNYCDSRCSRCSFTQRCLTYLDSQDTAAEAANERPLTASVGAALHRTIAMLGGAEHKGKLPAPTAAVPAGDHAAQPHRLDPLAVQAREYGQLAWRISRAIAPLAAARDDAPLVEAVATI